METYCPHCVGLYQKIYHLFKCLVIFLLCQRASSQQKTVEEYCFSQLPPMVNNPKGFTSFTHLLRICSDIGLYNECWMNRLSMDQPNGPFRVRPHESYMPLNDSIEFAGYLFCSLNFMLHEDIYGLESDVMTECQKRVDEEKCEKLYDKDVPFLRAAFNTTNYLDMYKISCRMSYKFWKCVRDQYIACNKKTERMFDYYIARLGDDCLLQNLEPNPVVLSVQCAGGGEAGPRDGGNSCQYHGGLSFLLLLWGSWSVMWMASV